MPKLSQIIEPFAAALGLPSRSMNVFAMVLRKGGLITKGGRGPAGAEMRSSDGTNLLLAPMVGGEATSADKSVIRMRSALRRPSREDLGSVPAVGFLREDLGATLDALIDDMMSGGPCNEETGLPITNMALTVHQPSDFNCSAELWIDDGNSAGTVEFYRKGEAFDGIDIANLSAEEKTTLIASLRRPRMHVSTSVGLDELFEIASILGGSELENSND